MSTSPDPGQSTSLDAMTSEEWIEYNAMVYPPKPDPPGPLNRAQHALWRRRRGRALGNALSSARYWLWRLSR